MTCSDSRVASGSSSTRRATRRTTSVCTIRKRHHEERLASVKTISREIGPACVEAFTQRLFKRRSWGPMADRETYAHLEHLRIAGQAERTLEKDGSFLYEAG